MTTKLDEKEFTGNESIGYLTGVAYRSINKRLGANLKASGNKITSEQYGILKQLWISEGQTQLDLACKTSKDKPGITRLLNNLEKKGFIERKVNENDKRCNKIYLTSKGKKMQKTSLEVGEKTVIETTSSIDKSEMQICKKVLAQICTNLISEEDII
jgi:DNA-binding MarR family transcriptional regulator